MAIFVVYASIRLTAPVTDEVIAAAATTVVEVDVESCVWRNAADPTILQLSASVEAENPARALAAGRAFATEAAQLLEPQGAVTEVVAYFEEGQLLWRPRQSK